MVRVFHRMAACGLRLTSTRAPLLMLRGAARPEAGGMRPLEAWSMPAALVAAKPLGAAEALALVLTPAVSLKATQDAGTDPGVCTAGEQEASPASTGASPGSSAARCTNARLRAARCTVLACYGIWDQQ